MKIKDLRPDASLAGVRFVWPGDGKEYYWVSQWRAGVWGKTSTVSNRLFPLFVKDLTEALEWDLAGPDDDDETDIRE